MKHAWRDTVVWVGTVLVAVWLAVLAPKGMAVLGRLPNVAAADLNHRPVLIPDGLKAERTLLLLNFKRGLREEAEGWITGLRLREDSSLAWLRVPVLDDGGHLDRGDVEGRLLAHYPNAGDRANIIPVFTDQAAFLKASGLSRTDRIYALVVNRQGEVLARVEGPFSEESGRLIRHALTSEYRL